MPGCTRDLTVLTGDEDTKEEGYISIIDGFHPNGQGHKPLYGLTLLETSSRDPPTRQNARVDGLAQT